MATQWVELKTQEGPMDAFMARPEGPHRHPAMVVIQEAFGVNGHIQDICQRLASAGYVALAPELFHRSGRRLTFGYDEFPKLRPLFSQLTNASVVMDIQVALETLRARPDVQGQAVGIIGFCVGGFAALLAATRTDVATAVAYYAGGVVHERPGMRLQPFVQDLAHVRAPVLALFGGADTSISPADVEAVKAALDKSGTRTEVITYPGAQHGFNCDQRAAFHPEAARQAWARTLSWLRDTLPATPGQSS